MHYNFKNIDSYSEKASECYGERAGGRQLPIMGFYIVYAQTHTNWLPWELNAWCVRVLLRILLGVSFHQATKIDFFFNLLKNTHPLCF